MTVIHPVGGHGSFDHTGISAGSSLILSGLLGYEVDGGWVGNPCRDFYPQCPNFGTGQYDTIKLADSIFQCCSQGINGPPEDPEGEGHSYMTIYTAVNGPTYSPHAQVFATGTMQWNWGLDDFGYGGTSSWGPSRVNAVARQITYNVLRKLTGKNTSQLP